MQVSKRDAYYRFPTSSCSPLQHPIGRTFGIALSSMMMICLPPQGTPPPTQQPIWPTAHTAHSQHCGHTALPPRAEFAHIPAPRDWHLKDLLIGTHQYIHQPRCPLGYGDPFPPRYLVPCPPQYRDPCPLRYLVLCPPQYMVPFPLRYRGPRIFGEFFRLIAISLCRC